MQELTDKVEQIAHVVEEVEETVENCSRISGHIKKIILGGITVIGGIVAFILLI